jgi:hypothetical protein
MTSDALSVFATFADLKRISSLLSVLSLSLGVPWLV